MSAVGACQLNAPLEDPVSRYHLTAQFPGPAERRSSRRASGIKAMVLSSEETSVSTKDDTGQPDLADFPESCTKKRTSQIQPMIYEISGPAVPGAPAINLGVILPCFDMA